MVIVAQRARRGISARAPLHVECQRTIGMPAGEAPAATAGKVDEGSDKRPSRAGLVLTAVAPVH